MFYGGWLAWALAAPRRSSSAGSSSSSRRRSRSSRSSGATSSPASTPGSSSSTCAASPGTRIEETERKFAADRGHDPHGHPAGARSRRCSTTSASRTAASTSRSARARSSRRPTARSSSRSRRTTARRRDYVRKLRATLASDVPRADLLLPRAGHLDPGAQLRPRRAHRRAGRRAPSATRTQTLRRRAADRRARAGRSPAPPTCTSRRCRKQPELRIDVDRTMAGQLGLTERDVASDLLVSLVVERDRVAELLARQARRPVPRRRADPAARDRLDRRAEHDAHLDRRRPRRSSSRTSPPCRAPTGP